MAQTLPGGALPQPVSRSSLGAPRSAPNLSVGRMGCRQGTGWPLWHQHWLGARGAGACGILSNLYQKRSHKGTQREGLEVPQSLSWPMRSFGSSHRHCLVLRESLKNSRVLFTVTLSAHCGSAWKKPGAAIPSLWSGQGHDNLSSLSLLNTLFIRTQTPHQAEKKPQLHAK